MTKLDLSPDEMLFRINKMEDFLRQEGYRRCDIAACNCGSWHGGSASARLTEIREALEENDVSVNDRTILDAIHCLIAEKRALSERERAAFLSGVLTMQEATIKQLTRLYDVTYDGNVGAGVWLARDAVEAINPSSLTGQPAAPVVDDAMVTALRPFAKKASDYEARHPGGRYPVSDSTQITHRLGDFRVARAALEAALKGEK